MSLQASVISYEDVLNNAGEILTKYIVQVKYLNASYAIAKRYSEFKTLYEILKDLVPPDYKFPNKSMFHNNAQATKERRIRGFDELLQVLLSRKPVPTVMERFLGINDRKAKSLQIRSKSVNLGKSNGSDGQTTNSSVSGNDNTRPSNDSESGDVNDIRFTEQMVIVPQPRSSNHELVYSPEKYELIKALRRATPHIIMSSMKVTSGVYIVLVIVRIVDITNSDFSEILLTMCILSFVVSFIRINLLKYTLAALPKKADAVIAVTAALEIASVATAAAVPTEQMTDTEGEGEVEKQTELTASAPSTESRE